MMSHNDVEGNRRKVHIYRNGEILFFFSKGRVQHAEDETFDGIFCFWRALGWVARLPGTIMRICVRRIDRTGHDSWTYTLLFSHLNSRSTFVMPNKNSASSFKHLQGFSGVLSFFIETQRAVSWTGFSE